LHPTTKVQMMQITDILRQIGRISR